MNLVVLSSKRCWSDNTKSGQFATVGGFPQQMKHLADLFSSMELVLVESKLAPPNKLESLELTSMEVNPVPEPPGTGWRRKVALLIWLPRYGLDLWNSIDLADSVHTPVPGDIGFIGLLLAWVQRKPLFVRHCGTWGEPVTVADRLLMWVLERIAGKRNVVMATGGGDMSPSQLNPHITWIYSTTLTEAELQRIPDKEPWQHGDPVRIVTVGRLTRGKNMIDAIRALPQIHSFYPKAVLHIVGDGEARSYLEEETRTLGLQETVIFHGNVAHDEVMRILQECDIFAFPTKTKEGFPKAVLEALACGLPVITSNVSVLPSLIGSERGVILDEVSADAVADAVLDMLSDPMRFATMVHSAQETAEQYTLERWQAIIGERLEAAWEQPLRQTVEQSQS